MSPVRIASVLPSATEIVCTLGARDELVGRSAECDYPASVRSVRVLMRPRTLDRALPSGEIDRRVRSARGHGESLYELDVAALVRTAPDLLITQDLCGVCSVTEAEVEEACARAGAHPRIVSISPTRLDEVWESILTVGRAIGREAEARSLVDGVRARTRPVPATAPVKVAVVEWLDPPILAGLWTPDIVRAAGGVPLGPRPGEPGARTTWSELAREKPDIAVLSPCAFSVARTLSELGGRPGLEVRTALAGARVVVADEAYFSRPGPRLAHGVELVRTLVSGARLSGGLPMPAVPLGVGPSEAAA